MFIGDVWTYNNILWWTLDEPHIQFTLAKPTNINTPIQLWMFIEFHGAVLNINKHSLGMRSRSIISDEPRWWTPHTYSGSRNNRRRPWPNTIQTLGRVSTKDVSNKQRHGKCCCCDGWSSFQHSEKNLVAATATKKQIMKKERIPSGNLLHGYWKWPLK